MWMSVFASRWKAHVLAFVSGALCSLAFAPHYFWPLIFVALPLLYILLVRSDSRARALWRGFFFGYGFFMAGTWWIANSLLVDAEKFAWMLPFSILGLSAAMALWLLPLAYCVYRYRLAMNPAVFAVFWVLFEWLRSLGIFGFPWNLAGYISLASLELAQAAALIGVYGLSLIVIWLALMPIYWLERKPRRVLASVTAALFLGSAFAFGHVRLSQPVQYSETTLRIVQPNIHQEIKGTRAGVEEATAVLEQLTALPPESDKTPDITIWPETAYPFTVRTDGPVLLPGFKGVLLTGAVRAEGVRPDVKIWNSLIALAPTGDVLGVYDKHQLVPFGEFVPLRHILPLDKITPGDTDFSRGNGPKTLTVGHLPPFSPQICYEGIFSMLAVDASHPPAWMLNVTNDGWFGDSAGPHQHFDMVRMRAIEQGIPLVRAANSGISGVVDGYGRIVAQMGLNERGVLDVQLPIAVRGRNSETYIQP